MDSLGHFQTSIVTQSDLGLHGNHGLDHEALFQAFGNHFGHGLTHHLQACLGHSGLVSLGEQIVDGGVMEHISAEHLFDHSAGSLAAAEAGNIVLLALTLESLVNSSLKGFCVHRELQLYQAVCLLFRFDQFHLFFLQYSEVLLPTRVPAARCGLRAMLCHRIGVEFARETTA